MAHLRLGDAQPRDEPAERRQQKVVGDGHRIRQPTEERKLEAIGVEAPLWTDHPSESYRDEAESEAGADDARDRLDELDLAEPGRTDEEQRLRDEEVRHQRPTHAVERREERASIADPERVDTFEQP